MNRAPLRILGGIAVGLFASSAMMFSANTFAFLSLSPEEIIKKFMDEIINYVAGDIFKTIDNIQKYLTDLFQDLYSPEREETKKEALANAQAASKKIEVEEMIYNQNAMSDAHPIATTCRPSPGVVIKEATSQMSESNRTMQANALEISVNSHRSGGFDRRLSSAVGDIKSADGAGDDQKNAASGKAKPIIPTQKEKHTGLPPQLDGEVFFTDKGYLTEQDARNALDYLQNIAEFKRVEAFANYTGNAFTPTLSSALTEEAEIIAEVMNANAALNNIYLSRLRDQTLAARMADRTTDVELQILQLHVNESGMSLIDMYNYEAEIAAFNPEYTKDILSSSSYEQGEGNPITPSLTRALKYAIQLKSIEAAFEARLAEQQTTKLKLQSILVKQQVRQA